MDERRLSNSEAEPEAIETNSAILQTEVKAKVGKKKLAAKNDRPLKGLAGAERYDPFYEAALKVALAVAKSRASLPTPSEPKQTAVRLPPKLHCPRQHQQIEQQDRVFPDLAGVPSWRPCTSPPDGPSKTGDERRALGA